MPDRAVLAVTGADARPFLHNLLTQDVESLADGELRFGLLLTPQGRALHDMLLLGRADGVWLDVAASAAEDLTRRLTLYKLRAKVSVAAADTPVWAAWGEAAAGSSPDPRAPELGVRLYGAAPPETATADDYDRHRLSLGVVDLARDGQSDRAYPLELNFDLLGGVDFKKGCFVGQETTSRMKRRGTLKTRAAAIAYDGLPPPAGAELLAGTLRAGEVVAARDGVGVATVRLDRLAGDLRLAEDERPVVVRLPDGVVPLTEPA